MAVALNTGSTDCSGQEKCQQPLYSATPPNKIKASSPQFRTPHSSSLQPQAFPLISSPSGKSSTSTHDKSYKPSDQAVNTNPPRGVYRIPTDAPSPIAATTPRDTPTTSARPPTSDNSPRRATFPVAASAPVRSTPTPPDKHHHPSVAPQSKSRAPDLPPRIRDMRSPPRATSAPPAQHPTPGTPPPPAASAASGNHFEVNRPRRPKTLAKPSSPRHISSYLSWTSRRLRAERRKHADLAGD